MHGVTDFAEIPQKKTIISDQWHPAFATCQSLSSVSCCSKEIVCYQALRKIPEDRGNRPGIAAKGKTVVVWFMNDLRLHDNEVLKTAQNAATNILPLFVFDPRCFQKVTHA